MRSPLMLGARAESGPSALLRLGGVGVLAQCCCCGPGKSATWNNRTQTNLCRAIDALKDAGMQNLKSSDPWPSWLGVWVQQRGERQFVRLAEVTNKVAFCIRKKTIDSCTFKQIAQRKRDSFSTPASWPLIESWQ